MTMVDAVRDGARYDGVDGEALAGALGLSRVVVFDEVGSTLDVAHALAAQGAAAGTLVLADAQSAGRGRQGRSWASEPGRGIWLTLVERPADARALEVLSLRLGLRAAPVLDAFCDQRVQLKWPNDLYVAGGKLAGILVEARWHADRLDWIAVGFGLNVQVPDGVVGAAALRPGTARVDVLRTLVPALRAAARQEGPLRDDELAAFAARDLARGRRCTEPVKGTVRGLDATGALLVDTATGTESVRAGSLVFAEDA